MQFHTARELHSAYEDLEFLLALRQAPAIAILLRHRFLEAVLDADGPVWSAYGFPTAVGLLASLGNTPLEQLPSDGLEAILRMLDSTRDRPAPPLPGASTWHDDHHRATVRLRETIQTKREALPEPPPGGAFPNGPCSIAIPVVAELIDPRKTHTLYAGLRVGLLAHLDVSVEFLGRHAAGDLLVVDGDVAPETRAAFIQTIPMVNRFRVWGAPAFHSCLFRVRCSPPGARIRGRSAALGFLLAAATARSRYALGPSYRSIAQGTAATGDLAGTRTVPVDPSTLTEKIRACLDGPVRRIVVPADQAEQANRVLEAEKEHRPRRSIEILPTVDARDLWNSRHGAFRRHRRPARSVVGQWSDRLTRSRARMGLVGASVALLAVVLIIWTALRTAPPVSAEWDGDTLTLRNQHRLVTRRIRLPYAPDYAHQPGILPNINRPIVDLDQDGMPDVVAIHGGSPGSRDLLTAVGANGKIMWQRRSYPLAPAISGLPGDMLWWLLAVMPRQTGQPDLLALSRSRQGSLSLIVRLESTTGAILGTLQNHGHLERYDDIILRSRDIRMIALCGTENRLGRGLVVFVDPPRMTTPHPFTELSTIPIVAESASLSTGVMGAWSFAVDRFAGTSRTGCNKVYAENDGTMHIEVSVFRLHGFIFYEIDPGDLITPTVLRAYITDATKDNIRAQIGAVPDEVFEEEALRLAREVQTLTPEGWRPARLGPDVLPTNASSVSR